MTVASRCRQAWRNFLLRFRVFHVSPLTVPRDAYSPDYLMLVLQAKRLAASRALTRFRWQNLPLWPVFFVLMVLRMLDLKLTTTMIESMLLEERLKMLSQDQQRQQHAGDRQT